ncbi:MAG TPA: cytochrome c biogenesis protein CcsA [Acidimicrobiales bacterium]|nr:cytochrome c biogenesis protein CcsA [Acidimicrobiales bacterium]
MSARRDAPSLAGRGAAGTSGAISSGETAPVVPTPPRAATHVGLFDQQTNLREDDAGTVTTLASPADGGIAPSGVSPQAMARGAMPPGAGLVLPKAMPRGAKSPAAGSDKVVRAIGIAALAGVAATVWLGLWVTPNAVNFGNLVRLLYIHPPLAWVMFIAYGMATLSSLLYLWPRTRHRRFDHLAGSSAEVGVVFTGLTLVTGSIWGRPTWGVWWTWDPLLTTTALLFVLYLGYLALRRVPGDRETVAKRAAIAGLIAFLDVPIVFFSVSWWRSLHQAPTVDLANGHLYVHGSMAWTLLLGFVSFTLVYVWLLVHRYRLAVLRDREDDEGLEAALAERWAEGTP